LSLGKTARLNFVFQGYNFLVEEFLTNDEIRAEVSQWVARVKRELEEDPTRKTVLLGPFRDPWAHAIAIGEVISHNLRWREIAPNPSPRFRCLQVAHWNNLLNWTPPELTVLLFVPENPFQNLSRFEFIDSLRKVVKDESMIGDVEKFESGWAVSVTENCASGILSQKLSGFDVRKLSDDEIQKLPPATRTGPKSAIVASPRVDAVAAGILRPSREQVKKQLDAGGVLLNYQPVTKPGKEVSPRDVVVVRGAGRFRVENISGQTRKGRILVFAEILNGP